ncbi:MAG: helix-turn-helix domain-containing protein [Lachnospiraceae bacterium]|nr:helix-turn-helix domain-containing protein [Lachnospiraceae bacterium]
MSQVAARLKEVREEKNFTIEAVAEKTGIVIEELQAFEEGSKLPDAGVLMQLSKVYEMSIDRILYSGSEMPKYDESKAVYANVKPVAVDAEDAQKESGKQAESAPAKKASILTHLVFPVLCIIIYIFLGVAGGFWHPGWMIFLGIPLYYALVFITSRIGKNVDNAVKEYMEEEEKKQ